MKNNEEPKRYQKTATVTLTEPAWNIVLETLRETLTRSMGSREVSYIRSLVHVYDFIEDVVEGGANS